MITINIIVNINGPTTSSVPATPIKNMATAAQKIHNGSFVTRAASTISPRHPGAFCLFSATPLCFLKKITLKCSCKFSQVWFAGRKKSNAETDNTILKNLELSINLYKQIIDDLKKEIHDLNVQVQDLEKKVEELMIENRKLKRYNGL